MAFNTPLLFLCLSLLIASSFAAMAPNSALWTKLHLKNVGFSWANCGPGADPLQIKSLAVTPDPIAIPGNITIAATAALTAAIPTDLRVSLTMEKKVGSFYVKVPCIDNVGSCNYGNLCAVWADACPKHFSKYGIPCQCPIPPNNYSVPDAVIEVTSSLPSIIDGEFRVTADIAGGSGHIGCLRLQIILKG